MKKIKKKKKKKKTEEKSNLKNQTEETVCNGDMKI